MHNLRSNDSSEVQRVNNFLSLVSGALLLYKTWCELIPDIKSLDFLTMPTLALDEADSLSLAPRLRVFSSLLSVKSWVLF